MPIRLPDTVRTTLATEFRTAADQIAQAQDMKSKLFFFSAFFAAIGRAFNAAWSDELALLHLVLQSTHGTVKMRLSQMQAGADLPIMLPDELPDALTKAAGDLAVVLAGEIIEESALFAVLARLATLPILKGRTQDLAQRATAARRAISLRCSGLSFSALAFPPFFPPFFPPNLPSLTASGFLPSGIGGSGPSSVSSVTSWTIRKALTAKSWSFFFLAMS